MNESEYKLFMERRSRIEKKVREYLHRNVHLCKVYSSEAVDHVCDIGTAIMVEKWGIGPTPGSFVNAICTNNLSEAVGRADSVNLHMIPFYVTLYENLEYVD